MGRWQLGAFFIFSCEIQPRLVSDLPRLVSFVPKRLPQRSKARGDAPVPPGEESAEILTLETFVCTYLPSCFAWSPPLRTVTPGRVRRVTNAFPGRVLKRLRLVGRDLTGGGPEAREGSACLRSPRASPAGAGRRTLTPRSPPPAGLSPKGRCRSSAPPCSAPSSLCSKASVFVPSPCVGFGREELRARPWYCKKCSGATFRNASVCTFCRKTSPDPSS